jgi:hypothetical protein
MTTKFQWQQSFQWQISSSGNKSSNGNKIYNGNKWEQMSTKFLSNTVLFQPKYYAIFPSGNLKNFPNNHPNFVKKLKTISNQLLVSQKEE